VRRALSRFAIAGLLAVLVTTALMWVVVRRAGREQTRRDVVQQARLAGAGIVEPALTDNVLRHDEGALNSLDRVVQERILSDRVIRVKLWTDDGEILYSDESRLIGERYPLGDDEQNALRDGSIEAEKSSLDRPESRFERGNGSLMSVYFRIRTPNGTPLLYEQYERVSSVTADTAQLVRRFAIPALAALALLWLVQLPLAWKLAGDVERSRRDRERALQQAIAASALERQRIATDLHDGIVQDLVGLSYRLAAVAENPSVTREDSVAALTEGAAGARAGVRRLRAALLAINPDNLQALGLRRAVDDLVSPLTDSGVAATVRVEDFHVKQDVETVVYRGLQEVLRNVHAHAHATEVSVDVRRVNGKVMVAVTDNGRGFTDADRARREQDGHVGLRLHADLLRQLGGNFEISSTPGGGTHVSMEVPA
jgi:two-component system, NarL family, sensor kinase